MKHLNEKVNKWRKETGLGFVLYATPAENLGYRFANIDKEKFGSIQDITDKEAYTDSYHINTKEKIDVFEKLKIETSFQKLSPGGAISYIEITPDTDIEQIIKFIYDNIQYGELLISGLD